MAFLRHLLSVDPGVICPAAGLWDIGTSRLLAARRFKGDGFACDLNAVVLLACELGKWAGASVVELALEWPQVYGGGRAGGRKDPNDLFPLAAFDAVLALYFPAAKVTLYTPHEWKGSIHKTPTYRKIVDRLALEEREVFEDFNAFSSALTKAEFETVRMAKPVDPKHLASNTCDAVGIGLKHLGRFERHRVIAR